MRVAIVGAGAMGTLLGHGFCKGGHDVSILDLPNRTAQLQSDGKLVVVGEDGAESDARPALITSDYREAGVHDVVILATKSQDLPAVASNITELTSDTSTMVTIQNGIPWWYLQELSHDFGNARIQCLDPTGLLERSISPSQILGCVAYPAAILEQNGRVRHIEGKNFPVGELDGNSIARIIQSAI